ncbi:molybdopterin molybdotransferase MoeA [Algoriphagus machipongonensis]|uniref:Molybdopterin molybdenumtransferase n=1 Tax=Algoriphagus machipongonensis TaxID=388413 RepID=A3HUR5_9BACT|nr:gephyrin-like molybdotransferase Glp [Algoriphagus machipongonensis]EAZ81887.1 molybdopterin biosynthesis MoeA protein [Algoriphagus machipongonensis]
MISVFQALSIIDQNTEALAPVLLPLSKLNGCVLAEDVQAPISLPPFRQSAMDGYAFKHGKDELRLIGESKAGDFAEFKIGSADCVRIFTGARVPDQADTVVMQEHVEKTSSGIRLIKTPEKGTNVRPVGEQIKQGEIVLKKGTKINAAIVGFLAGLGISEVLVIPIPKIALIVTGNELQEPGTPLKPGSVYESNRVMIETALKAENVELILSNHVLDDKESTFEAIRVALDADMVLISGGISVGDYDFVKESLERNGVEEKFYKINQKPGKPLWYGKKGKTQVFALPGNPASSLTCFLIYATAAIRKMNGTEKIDIQLKKGKMKGHFVNKFQKALFLQAREQSGVLEVYPKQASSMLVSFTQSNAFLFVPEDVKEIQEEDEVHYIPFKL